MASSWEERLPFVGPGARNCLKITNNNETPLGGVSSVYYLPIFCSSYPIESIYNWTFIKSGSHQLDLKSTPSLADCYSPCFRARSPTSLVSYLLSLPTLIMTLTGEVERKEKKSNTVYRIKNSSTEQRFKKRGGVKPRRKK